MILLVIAAWIGLTLAEKRAEHYGVSQVDLSNLTFSGLIAFIIAGRVSFALQNIPAFVKSPLGIFSINPDLFDAMGALVGALLVLIIYSQRNKLPFWSALDALTPFFAVLVIGSGLSHLAAGTAFGSPTDLPWAINLWNAERHPVQIYDTLASTLTFCLIWFKKPGTRPGMNFLIFSALTSLTQLFLTAFRGDGEFILNGLRQGQIIAWIVLAACFLFIETRLKQDKHG